MFTGIIEHLGVIRALEPASGGARVTIDAPTLAGRLEISKSIAVNGCCLTVTSTQRTQFSADLSSETLNKTTFGVPNGIKPGSRVNLEQPLVAGQEFGGHFVLGHVDGTGEITKLTPESHGGGSWTLAVRVPPDFARYVVPKGSITIDGISLTVARWNEGIAEIAVIPYTYEHTNLRDRKIGDAVNLEADVLGKYIERYLEARGARTTKPGQ
jgi:riboflavin synthase